jgi:hypothetical protein
MPRLSDNEHAIKVFEKRIEDKKRKIQMLLVEIKSAEQSIAYLKDNSGEPSLE